MIVCSAPSPVQEHWQTCQRPHPPVLASSERPNTTSMTCPPEIPAYFVPAYISVVGAPQGQWLKRSNANCRTHSCSSHSQLRHRTCCAAWWRREQSASVTINRILSFHWPWWWSPSLSKAVPYSGDRRSWHACCKFAGWQSRNCQLPLLPSGLSRWWHNDGCT